jgi:hypothetical protein
MKGKTEITVEEWLKEIEKIERLKGEGHTVSELADIWGLSKNLTRRRIEKASRAGWVTVSRRQRMTIDGRACQSPCYQFSKPKEGKK